MLTLKMVLGCAKKDICNQNDITIRRQSSEIRKKQFRTKYEWYLSVGGGVAAVNLALIGISVALTMETIDLIFLISEIVLLFLIILDKLYNLSFKIFHSSQV